MRLIGQKQGAWATYDSNSFLKDIEHVLIVVWSAKSLGYACQQSTLASLLVSSRDLKHCACY